MEYTRLLFDFGLVVLIWIVQLLIYPGFKYYSPSDLKSWHKAYTNRLPLIVVPLMLGQLIAAAGELWIEQNLYTIGSMSIVILLWLLTFLIFVPLHKIISEGPSNKEAVNLLVSRNWWRTLLWTSLFLWNLTYNFL